MQIEADGRARAEQIEKLFVRYGYGYGEIVLLSQVVRVEKKAVLQNVTRRDCQRVISIYTSSNVPAWQE